ncbi:hypothetical protein D3C75_526160 [compost metagenome]
MQICTQIQAELAHKRLGCAINVTARVRPASRSRTDIDNVTTITLHHTWQHGASHIHQTFIVGVDHRFPVIRVSFMSRFHTQRQARVIHQHVNIAPLGRQLFHRLLDSRAITYIKLQRNDAITQFVFQLLQALQTAAGSNHFMALLDETTGNALTKSGGGAGYQNNHLTVPQRFLCRNTLARERYFR